MRSNGFSQVGLNASMFDLFVCLRVFYPSISVSLLIDAAMAANEDRTRVNGSR
jgi:hypothetical protein